MMPDESEPPVNDPPVPENDPNDPQDSGGTGSGGLKPPTKPK